jgi:hypothetical protein
MDNLSDQISRLAAEFDPQKQADADGVRAFIQGILAGGMARSSLVKIDSIETPLDEQGDYLHYFVVVTQSGIRVRVNVELD